MYIVVDCYFDIIMSKTNINKKNNVPNFFIIHFILFSNTFSYLFSVCTKYVQYFLLTHYFRHLHWVIIPVTRRVKGYTRFVGKYVTGRRKRFRPHKVYIFLIRITSRVDLAMSVRLSVRPDER